MSIEAFALLKEKMEVYVNLRIEKHGDDNANGWDVKLAGDFANHAILPKLDENLLAAFYTDDKQRELAEFKRKLKFQRINKALPWDWEVPRISLTIHDEHDEAENLTITDCTAHKFSFLPKDGGTVEFAFTVKTKAMDENQVLKLLRANGQELLISMECKPVEEKPDNFQQADLLAQEPMSEARKEAEAQFANGAVPASGDAAAGLPTLEAEAAPVVEEVAPAATEKPAAAPRARRGTGKAITAPE